MAAIKNSLGEPRLRAGGCLALAILAGSLFVFSGCSKNSGTSTAAQTQEVISTTFHVGQAVVGDGKEIAHVDIVIGHKDGPVGNAFVNALANQKEGHSNLLAVIGPNQAIKPSTVLIPKVGTHDTEHSILLFGPVQSAVAKAVADALEKGVIPANKADDWVVVCSVYLHWNARDKKKVFKYNYLATKKALERALSGTPSLDEINKYKTEMDADWLPQGSFEETQTARAP